MARLRGREVETVAGGQEQIEKWWWVAALYKAIHIDVRRRRHTWERTVFLIRAKAEAEAEQIAWEVAKSKQHEYKAANGKTVRWVLQGIEHFVDIFDEDIQQGTEVYWHFFERVDK